MCHTLDLVILRYALTEVQSSFKVLRLDFGIRQSDTVEVFKLKVDLSCLGRPTINKLITLGGQEPLPFTPSPFQKYTISVYYFISDLKNPHKTPSVTASSLLLHFFSSTHPILTMWAKAQENFSQAKVGPLTRTARITLVTGFTNMQGTDGSNQSVSLPTTF